MGAWITTNFDQINYTFTTGCWKVHSAIRRSTNERVSIWMVDQELLAKITPDKSMQEKYLLKCLVGIQQARKVRHPRILNVTDIQDSNVWELLFVTEPVSSDLGTLIGSLDKIDSSYIGYQLLEALDFLHDKSNIAHLGISPSAIFLNESLDVKLFGFDFSAKIINGNAKIPFDSYKADLLQPDLNYCAPEVVICKECSPATDIFEFALLFYELLTTKRLLNYKSIREYDTSRSPATLMSGLESSFYAILTDCLNPMERMRPTAHSLLESDLFTTVNLKAMRYLDIIITKDPKDKFGFFKGLGKVLNTFSPMLVRVRILPILVEECKRDVRFAPILLGLIFIASERFTVSEFTELVFSKISFLVNVTDPPQVLVALIQGLPLILDKTESNLHNDCVYPILYQALQSPEPAIQKEILKKLPIVVDKMSESGVRKELLPRLVEMAFQSKEAQIVASSIGCIPICLKKADNDLFLKEQMAKLLSSFRRNQHELVARSMAKVILALEASPSGMLSRAIPAATEVITNDATPLYVKKQLCQMITMTVVSYSGSLKLEQVTEDVPMVAATPTKSASAEFTPAFDTPSKPATFETPKFNTTFESPKPAFNTTYQAPPAFESPKPAFNTTYQAPPAFEPNKPAFPNPPQTTSFESPKLTARPIRTMDGGSLQLPPTPPKKDDLLDLF